MAAPEDSIDLDFDEYDDFDDVPVGKVESTILLHRQSNNTEYSAKGRVQPRHLSPVYESRKRRSSSSSPTPADLQSVILGNESGSVNEKRVIGARRFGLDPPLEESPITKDELLDLYKSMGVDPCDPRIRFHSVLVHGVDGLTAFQVQKIFAEFSPTAVDMIDNESCNVIWNERYTVGKMMLEMTKPLKRIRGHRETEEGEVDDTSDEEDGEMKEEQGDDVIISIRSSDETVSKEKRTTDDYVEVDIDKIRLPPGRWRVLTKHVAQNRFIILRLSLREDLRKGKLSMPRKFRAEGENFANKDGFTYKWTNKKDRIRPGLNIFDAKGNELEWDYEHDTRFYVGSEQSASSPKAEGRPDVSAEEPAQVLLGKRKIKSRGRGAKKTKNLDELLSSGSSMVADREEVDKPTKGHESEPTSNAADEDQDSDISDDLDPNPTPQPWNYRKVQPRFESFDSFSRKEIGRQVLNKKT